MDYAKLLNEEQLKPVLDTEGAVLVLAGAGSGKTRVLTHRIAYLIQELNVSPYRILAITFTNKAAGEMKERVARLTGQNGVWISTFHSLCAKILRVDIDKLDGYKGNFSIYDDSDCQRMISRILKNFDLEDTKELKKEIRWHISNAKNHAMSADEYDKHITDVSNRSIVTAVFQAYESELRANNALDFDDLLLLTITLFAKRKDILEKYQEMFRYIHVDEFQDTNKIQYMLVRMLAQKYGNLFVVGDDDQSIYGWRWAEVANIRNFRKHFPGCRTYKLERNYRSTKNILDLANRIIANNADRMGKTLWTEGEDGVKVVYHTNYDEREEADYVLDQMNSLIRSNGYDYCDFAILVRANSISRPFEEKLTLYGYPYRVIGGNKFYERKEVKDFLAYLKFVANPYDSESILRIINVPKRGIGDGAIAKLIDACAQKRMTLLEGILNVSELGLPSAAANHIAQFSALAYKLICEKDLPLDEYADLVKDTVDFASMYDVDKEEDRGRLENIEDFVQSIKEYCKDNPESKLDEYLQSVSLVSDNEGETEDNCVTLATVHGVKGLEFRCVFIVGLEDGLFPSIRTGAPDLDLSEERRIMYVAVTRARERLYLTNAQSRFRYGKRENCKASRFLEEGGLAVKKASANYEDDYAADKRPAFDFASVGKSQPNFAKPIVVQSVQSKDVSGFKVGMRVVHTRFGEGEIVEIMGENARIKFPVLGVKTFNMRLAPITPAD